VSGAGGHESGAGPPLTAEQQRPLAVRGASVALSAGAGCGKTTVLTSRFLGALETPSADRPPLHSIVALTFTEKAASELRSRIRRDCYKRLTASRGDDVAHWRAVLRGLEAAPVSTFHEYCAGLLRRHALAAGIDPDFSVLDAAIADTVLDASLARCVRLWLGREDDDLIELAVEFGLRRVRESIAEMVRSRGSGDLADWSRRTEAEVVAAWRAGWEKDGRTLLHRPVAEAARACSEFFQATELDHPKLAKFRVDMLASLPDFQGEFDRDRLKELGERAKLPGGMKLTEWPSPEVNEKVKALLGSLRKAVERYFDRSQVDEASSHLHAAHGLRFVRLAVEARGTYDEAKRGRGGLDFDDLLVKTRDLLRRDAGAVRDDADHPVDFVLVDEFQDTDPVQDEILRLICGDGFAAGRLFVVGDFKQSIYRFRGARPTLFQTLREEFPEAGRLDLSENFRSTVGVIDFVNALFAGAFRGEVARLIPGPGAAPASAGPAVEFVWAEEPADAGSKTRPDAAAQRQTEARWVARLIRSKLDAGLMVRERKGPAGVFRKAHAGDFALLFRAMTDLKEYEHALQAEGLDFHVVGGKAFYAQQEVQDLVNVLSVVEDPVDAASLAGALRGPFFGLTDDALFWLGGGDSGRGDLADGLARCDAMANLSDADRARARRACGLLSGWRDRKDREPIADLVHRVLDESGAEAALLGEFLGDRKRANARKLVRLARRFDAEGGFTLGHFVARLRTDLAKPPREDQASTTDEEGQSVRLLSIHMSKGLEFPVVVVPDLNRKPGGDRKLVAFDRELGPLVRPGKPGPADAPEGGAAEEEVAGGSLGWVTYEARERAEDEDEAVRLFYVATTRARDHLILSAGAGPEAGPASPAMRLLDERFDRRTGESRAALPEGWAVPAVRVVASCPPPHAGGPRERRRPPRLRAVARVIRSATVSPDPPVPVPVATARPRSVDLDAARGLSPRAGRVDRLARAILADPRALLDGERGLAEAARLAARRQVPMAHADLVAETVGLLAPWLKGALGESLARAAAVERGVAWTVVWPQDGAGGGGSTVFHGRTEFFTRDVGGAWRAVVFSPPGASEPVERLRLLLSARAADALNYGPVVQGWRVRLDDGLHGEEIFNPPVLESAVDEALRVLCPAATA